MDTKSIYDTQSKAIAALDKIIDQLNGKALQEEIVGNKQNLIREYLDLYIEIRGYLSQIPIQVALFHKLKAALEAHRIMQELTFPILKSKAIDLRIQKGLSNIDPLLASGAKIDYLKKTIQCTKK